MCSEVDKCDTPSKVWLGPIFVLLLDKPEDVKVLLCSPESQDKPYPYEYFGLNLGLFGANG